MRSGAEHFNIIVFGTSCIRTLMYVPFPSIYIYIYRINNGLGKGIYIYICRWYILSYPFYCYPINYIAVEIEFPLLLQYMQYISFAAFHLVSPCLFPLPLRAEVNPRSICPLPFSHLGSVFRVFERKLPWRGMSGSRGGKEAYRIPSRNI